VLDDAAIRIVNLSAPYSRFPRSISEETDILHIERTWQFLSGNRFASR
jgi:protein TonB